MGDVAYQDAIAVLAAALKFGVNPSLEGITAICGELGRPQDAYRAIQITGTNGKTSTARLTAALLAAEEVTAGLYTSPELEEYRERIEVAGVPVSEREFASAVGAALGAAARVSMAAGAAPGAAADATEFELLTAAALWHFRERRIACAVLEVGMGGRWDATSVVSPDVAVITGVGLDHTAVLGETVEAIAHEKAAIIRAGSVAVLGPGTEGMESIFMDAAWAAATPVVAVRSGTAVLQGAAMAHYDVLKRPAAPDGVTRMRVTTPNAHYESIEMRAPAYQAGNLATAMAAAEALLGHELAPEAIETALASIRLPGRFELVRREPVVIVDGSHNPQAAGVLAGAITDAWTGAERPLALVGVLSDKDAAGIVRALAPAVAGFAVTQPASIRALPATELAAVVEQVTGAPPEACFGSVEEAVERLVAPGARDLVITGSLTTAGQARSILRDA